jgi:hypothetical protein
LRKKKVEEERVNEEIYKLGNEETIRKLGHFIYCKIIRNRLIGKILRRGKHQVMERA